MIRIVIDNIPFEVSSHVVWLKPGDDEYTTAPENFAEIARALVLCDYDDVGEHTYVAGAQLYERFVDTHDDQGNEVPEGRVTNLIFPLKKGMPPVRPLRVETGKQDGKKIIAVLEWDDPLNAVMTTSEAEEELGLAEGSIKKACQRSQLAARKSGGTWLIRRYDAYRRWKRAVERNDEIDDLIGEE